MAPGERQRDVLVYPLGIIFVVCLNNFVKPQSSAIESTPYVLELSSFHIALSSLQACISNISLLHRCKRAKTKGSMYNQILSYPTV